jgi:S1-C subfamily serine protease
LIDIILSGSPAERCGLKVGDVIVKLGAREIRGAGDLKQVLQELPIGEPISCQIERDKKSVDLRLTIGVK